MKPLLRASEHTGYSGFSESLVEAMTNTLSLHALSWDNMCPGGFALATVLITVETSKITNLRKLIIVCRKLNTGYL